MGDEIKCDGWTCEKCGIKLPSGIVGISSHWAECEGKEFMKTFNTDVDMGVPTEIIMAKLKMNQY